MRILIVDDERTFADILATGLTAEGFATDTAYDGRTGYLLAATGAYAAIVLDLMMPLMSGFAVCARLRAEGISTPVIVLTAKDGEYDEVEALSSGADDYLRKPFRYPVLVARIRALIRRPTTVTEAVLAMGDLLVDTTRRQVRRGAEVIEVGVREWAILETLTRAGGVVVSKNDLLQRYGPVKPTT